MKIATRVCMVALLATVPVSAQDVNDALTAVAPVDANRGWHSTTIVDDFDGTKLVTATSAPVFGEPYGRATLFVRCKNGVDLDIYAVFDYLNLIRGTARQHYVDVSWRQEEEASPVNYQLRMFEGDSGNSLFLVVSYRTWAGWAWQDNKVVWPRVVSQDLMSGSSFALRLPYYGHGRVVVRWDLEGARQAVGEVYNACPHEDTTRFKAPKVATVVTGGEAYVACAAVNKKKRISRVNNCMSSARYDEKDDVFKF